MTGRLLSQCTLKHLLSDTRTWPSTHLFRSNSHKISAPPPRRAHSTVFVNPDRRWTDTDACARTVDNILYLLRRAVGRKHGLANTDDGYVSLKRLLNHPEFRWMDVPTLQRIIDNDIKHRLDLVYDPGKGEDNWWLRAKMWDERQWILKPVFPRDNVGTAVYPTTREAWDTHISRNGIPRLDDEYIQITRGIPTNEYLDTLDDDSQVFVFINVRACIESGIRFFNPTPSAQIWSDKMPLLTKGDTTGYIPTSFFVRAEHVTARKKLLWGSSTALVYDGWVRHNDELHGPTGRRTLLKPAEGINGFADCGRLYGPCGMELKQFPELRQEALQALEVNP